MQKLGFCALGAVPLLHELLQHLVSVGSPYLLLLLISRLTHVGVIEHVFGGGLARLKDDLLAHPIVASVHLLLLLSGLLHGCFFCEVHLTKHVAAVIRLRRIIGGGSVLVLCCRRLLAC